MVSDLLIGGAGGVAAFELCDDGDGDVKFIPDMGSMGGSLSTTGMAGDGVSRRPRPSPPSASR